jgi:RNA polymerase sigma factor (sigma-70 family)
MTADAHLLRAVQAGDPDAWSELLERYRPFVLGRLRHTAKARNWFWLDDLDDLAQEVLVRFYEAVRDGRFVYRDESALRGFLVRTAFFAVMARKDEAALERPLSDLLPDEERRALAARFDLGAFADAAFDTLGRRQCLEELYRAIDSLAPARAEVLRLTLLGYKPREMAPLLDRSANAVSVLKFHALEDLQAALEAGDWLRNCGRYFLGDRSS